MIFDAHGDILTDIYEEALKGNRNAFMQRHYALYKKAGITHSIFVNWTHPDLNGKYFNQVFEVGIHALKDIKEHIKICYTYDDMMKAQEEDKMGIIIGVEGLKFLKNPEDIVDLYKLGLRHAILTWNEKNAYGSGAFIEDGGLTDQGKKLIALMESLGIIIDVAHANGQTFQDILQVTQKPVILSHGNARALCDHRRNYTDEQLLMIKEKNGVIGACAVANFISEDKTNQNVDFMAKQIDYMVKLIGIDHVGLGLDVCYYLFDGHKDTNIKGFETIGELNHLIEALRKLGYSDEKLNKIK